MNRFLGSMIGTVLLAIPLTTLGEQPAVPEEYSRGWRSVVSAPMRATEGVRVAYQPLSSQPGTSAPPPTALPATPSSPPAVSVPGAPALPSSVPITPAVPRTVVPSSGSCGSDSPAAFPAVRQAAVGWPPLLPIVSTPPAVYVTRGILGQPVVYVPGQPIRNFLRYLTP
ncbi:MAG: hypothetical protein KatS3mg109_0499 [Pirellulaceae bacterium]|nr:MAG: hypothetical protein KatS3mg109_0499 [Pirellulaceae bacterium]